MSDKSIKELRGQVRIIVKELLPEILREQLVGDIYKQVKEQVDGRMTEVDKLVNDVLQHLNARHQEVMRAVFEHVMPEAAKAYKESAEAEAPSEEAPKTEESQS